VPKTPAPFNVNSAGFTAYTVSTVCRRIIVCEVNQAGTTDYYVAYPTSTDGPRTRPAGKEFIMEKPPGVFFQPGDVPFYLKTASGSINFDADEQ
jgi:hypothetical protein